MASSPCTTPRPRLLALTRVRRITGRVEVLKETGAGGPRLLLLPPPSPPRTQLRQELDLHGEGAGGEA